MFLPKFLVLVIVLLLRDPRPHPLCYSKSIALENQFQRLWNFIYGDGTHGSEIPRAIRYFLGEHWVRTGSSFDDHSTSSGSYSTRSSETANSTWQLALTSSLLEVRYCYYFHGASVEQKLHRYQCSVREHSVEVVQTTQYRTYISRTRASSVQPTENGGLKTCGKGKQGKQYERFNHRQNGWIGFKLFLGIPHSQAFQGI